MKFLIFFFAALSLAQSNDLNLNEICQGILFQAIAHPYDSNLFIGCVQGRGTIFGCENVDDVFDPELIKCVDPSTLTTTEESTTTDITTQGTTTEAFNPCQGFPDGTFLPHPGDCAKFYFCSNGTYSLFPCFPGTIFDERIPDCVPGDPSTCEIFTTTTLSTTTTTTLPTTASTLPPTTTQSSLTTTTPGNGIEICFTCPTDGSTVYLPDTSSCNRYFECILTVKHLRSCPNNYHFDVFSRTCMSPDQALCVNLVHFC